MIFPASIGVSIESERVAIILLKSMIRTVRVVDARIHPLDPEQSVEENIGVVNGLIGEFIKENRISGVNVFVTIPRHLTLFRFIELPMAVKENLDETLRYEIEKYIPFPVHDICYDAEVVSEDKKAGTLEILIVAAKKERLEPYYRVGKGINVNLAGIDTTPNAWVNFFAGQQLLQYSITGMVYAGRDIIEINGIKNNRLFYSKWRSTLDTPVDGLIKNEMALMGEALGQEAAPAETQLVLCLQPPDEPLMEKLADAGEFSVSQLDISEAGISEIGMAPAYGAALKALQRVPMDINLLPAEHRKKPSKMVFYSLYGLSALLLVSFFLWAGSHMVQHRLAYNRLNTAIDSVKARISEIKGCQSENQRIEDKLEYLNAYVVRYGRLIDILNELSLAIPAHAWIYRFDFSGEEVQIEGLADNASELIPRLEKLPLFEDASFLTTITKGRDGKENFTIGLDVRKNPVD